MRIFKLNNELFFNPGKGHKLITNSIISDHQLVKIQSPNITKKYLYKHYGLKLEKMNSIYSTHDICPQSTHKAPTGAEYLKFNTIEPHRTSITHHCVNIIREQNLVTS